MNFKYGGLDNPDLYLDETIRRMCYSQRRLSAQLAVQLYNEKKKDKALAILNKIDEGISDELLPFDDVVYGASSEFANIYLALEQNEKAAKILQKTMDNALQQMRWYLSMNNRNLRICASQFSEIASNMYNFVFPLMTGCFEEAQYNAMYDEWKDLCNEFERRVN